MAREVTSGSSAPAAVMENPPEGHCTFNSHSEAFAAAAETGVALEINAHPSRLDLDDVYARRAKDMGIPISINTDAHSAEDMDLRFYGVATARRAWLENTDVANTLPVDRFLALLRR